MFCRCIVVSDEDHFRRWKEDKTGQEYIEGDMLRLYLTKRGWERFYRQWRRWMHAQFPYVPPACRDTYSLCFQQCMTEHPDILWYIQERLDLPPPQYPLHHDQCSILHQLFQYFHLT